MVVDSIVVGTFIIISLFCAKEALSEEPTIELLRTQDKSDNLLKNGDFERTRGNTIESWNPWQQGYVVVKGAGRNGSVAAYCNSTKRGTQCGIGQTLELNHKVPIPLTIRGWSKAKNVSGSPDSGYSVYVDVIFQDNTPLWGQTGKFNTGTHDWEMREFVIIPKAPIKRLTIYGIFRAHTGEVWFDDFAVYELGGKSKLVFDSTPISVVIKHKTKKENVKMMQVSTQDSLSMRYDWTNGLVASLECNNRELTESDVASGFLVRDVAADSDFYSFRDGVCPEVNLSLEAEIVGMENHIQIAGKVTDTTGNDRAVTLAFALPIDAEGWTWHDDIRHHRKIQSPAEYFNGVNIHTGANGMMSLYPFANINNDNAGLAIALDMDMPAQYRIAYNAGTKQFFIAYDLGLVKDTDNFPSSAPFKFVIYRTEPKWGFRSAAKKLYDIFPEYFLCRSKEQGIWMPFTDVSTVKRWQDFGFRYHEGINNVPFDDQSGILSFRYTEPSTWWMRMDANIDRTDEDIMKAVDESLTSDDARRRRAARALVVSGSFDEQGRYNYLVRNTPWCNGAVFSLNPNPYIPGDSEAKMNWNEEIKQRLYGADAKGEQDGEYLDSLEGYVTSHENFRREHFHYVNVPLTFSQSSKKPAIHKAFSVYEFTKWIAQDVHSMGKLMFANSVPHRFAFLCPYFDIMGTEMNWIGSDGSWNPASDNWMNFKRTMCYQKPYLFLMNTNYDKFTPDLVEKYFQLSLFYGFFPSMFSHNASENPYWRSPHWYNRDRHLFKRYIPVIKMVAEAGWEPVTYAISDNTDIHIERFGPDVEDVQSQGNIYFTLLNDSSEAQQAKITIMAEKLGIPETNEVQDFLSEENLNVISNEGQIEIEIPMVPEQVRLLHFPLGSFDE